MQYNQESSVIPPPDWSSSPSSEQKTGVPWGNWRWGDQDLEALQNYATSQSKTVSFQQQPSYPPPAYTAPAQPPTYPPQSFTTPSQQAPSYYPLSGGEQTMGYAPPPYPAQYMPTQQPPPTYPPTGPSLYPPMSSSQPQTQQPFGMGQTGFEPESKDKTVDFHQVYSQLLQPNGANKLVSEMGLKDYDIMLVGGMYDEKHPSYMKCHLDYLQGLGLNVKKLPIDPSASLEQNAQVINEAITTQSRSIGSLRKTLLVGHSKGGTAIAAALALFPKLKDHVESAVTMQSPFGGSVLANDLLSSAPSPVKSILKGILSKLKLDPSLLEGTKGNSKFFQEHDMRDVDVPILNLVTTSSSKNSILYPLIEYIKRKYGVENDGLVSTRDASLVTGSTYVVKLDGIDHGATVFGESDSKGIGSIVSSYKVEIMVLVLVILALTIARRIRKHRAK